MKAFNKISQILAVAGSAAAFVLFFIPSFVTMSADIYGGTYSFVGAQVCFWGTKVGKVGELAISSQILFCFILTAFATLFGALTFKFKKMRYAAPAVSLVAAIYMLVIALSPVGYFFDSRVTGVDNAVLQATKVSASYGPIIWILVAALFAAVVFGICHLLVDDRIMVAEGKRKMTIPQRLVHTLRDYKSELKKIVWPGVNDVVKNTIIVFIVCALVGGFIWLLDFGLGSLMKFISTLTIPK